MSPYAAEVGTELKSPATSMGMSALWAIFSSPFRSVCTCQETAIGVSLPQLMHPMSNCPAPDVSFQTLVYIQH